MIRKTTDLKNHAIRSPLLMGLAGATLGVVAAKLIRGATARRHEERIEWYDEGYDDVAGDAGDLGMADRARARAVDMKDRAAEMKDRAVHAVDETLGDVKRKAGEGARRVRDRMPSMDEVRAGADAAYRRVTDEQPIIGALIALGAGVALGMLLPVTDAEERALSPVVDRAAENIGHLEEKVRELTEKLDEKIAGEKQPEEPASTTSAPNPWPPPTV